ncbi:cytochrome c peroxidase [Desulfosalsimonas propionicica]|uniref:Cytochrome c peroxidase n=1 Tax=Desulfosalsimonas propionicica TaxID=332175 RepID=A0A7W0CAL9_9BACT|nr:cytochrome B6 [Desulfosalsimonas propionicica]MBA2882239.1 cytochrome c peroxidase [Desulfosalsimonas propionicica]
MRKKILAAAVCLGLAGVVTGLSGLVMAEKMTPLEGGTYMPVVIEKSFQETMEMDAEAKSKYDQRQQKLLEKRYDLSDMPSDTMMSAGRKPVQQGVRVKLHGGVTWEELSDMTPAEIKEKDLFPMGFRPLPHSKHSTGGQVFPQNQIDEMQKLENRNLERFDIEFDIPAHFTPEFPPPIYLTSRPDLGDVSQGKVLSIKNYYEMFKGILTPVQMEGMRLLLTPFPQQQFNQTEDRKVKEPSLGVTCLDCHVNGHTNAAFHLNPDTRPQAARFRLDTVSLRGMYNQQIHGSKRSLRSVEDFTEFEQRTAYFDGDHVTAAKKGVNLPDRASQVAMMAQMQNMFDFPPAPKLDPAGRLIEDKATEKELRGEEIFFGKGRCAECHPAPAYTNHEMQDLHLEKFYTPEMINDHYSIPDGPIKSFTLRGIKDSPPYHHDGRLLTLADTVEFFNLALGLDLTQQEKKDLIAFMLCL